MRAKPAFLLLLGLFVFSLIFCLPCFAQEVEKKTPPGQEKRQEVVPTNNPSVIPSLTETPTSTPTPTLIEKETDVPLTEENKSELEQLIEKQEIKGWWPTNILKIGIRKAVDSGISTNTIVLILLFPVTAALIAFSRNVIGLKGFSFFTPAIVSVAFFSTGILGGLLLFVTILLMATLTRVVMRRIRLFYLPYWPRMAIIIWAVSLSVLGLLIVAPMMKIDLANLGIFPILLLILLAETFISTQITRTKKEANVMVFETLVLALVNYIFISAKTIQKIVILNPEMTIITILLLDFLIAQYKGLRLMERWKFRRLID